METEKDQQSQEYCLIVLSIVWITKKIAIMTWNAVMGEGEGGWEKHMEL